ncbi:MAG: YcaO-like family protein [Candidatus Saganbacteria bacterium]|nr:YcaO-like family protein [Candidatus Saganbacteria bacterium]
MLPLTNFDYAELAIKHPALKLATASAAGRIDYRFKSVLDLNVFSSGNSGGSYARAGLGSDPRRRARTLLERMRDVPNDALNRHILGDEICRSLRDRSLSQDALAAEVGRVFRGRIRSLYIDNMGEVHLVFPNTTEPSQEQRKRGSLKEEWDRIFALNREQHVPVGELPVSLPVPDFLRRAVAQYPVFAPLKTRGALGALLGLGRSRDLDLGTSLRSCSPRETVRNLSALGFVENADAIPSHETFAVAQHRDLSAVVSLDAHHYSLRGRTSSSGKGTNLYNAMASLLQERVERMSAFAGCTANWPAGYVEDKKLIKAAYSDMVSAGLNVLDPHTLNLGEPYQNEPIYWTLAHLYVNGAWVDGFAPAQLVWTNTNFDEREIYPASANGLAAGNTYEEAMLHGLTEVIERDGLANTWYEPSRCFHLQARGGQIGSIVEAYQADGGLSLMDITTDVGIPSFQAFAWLNQQLLCGSGAHPDARIAAMRAICELSATVGAYNIIFGPSRVIPTPKATFATREYKDLPNYSSGNVGKDLEWILNRLSSMGVIPVVVNLTRSDFKVPVVRVIVPGLDQPEGVSVRQLVHLQRAQAQV